MESADWCYLAPGAGAEDIAAKVREFYAPFFEPAIEIVSGAWGRVVLTSVVARSFRYWRDEQFLLFWAGTLEQLTDPQRLCAAVTGMVDDEQALANLSGQFAGVAIHTPTSRYGVFSDHLSTIPVFCGPSVARAGICATHADLAAQLSTPMAEIDDASLAELLVKRRPTFPYTLYREIEQLAPGTLAYRATPQQNVETRRYWRLPRRSGTEKASDTAIALRERFVNAVARRLAPAQRVGILLSGGADSRMVLAAAPDHVEKHCFTFGEGSNIESETAERIARSQGVPWHFCQRSPTHYLDQIDPVTRLIGYQYEALQPHTFGIAQRHGFADYDWVAGGWFADTYLRAWYMPKQSGPLTKYGQPYRPKADPVGEFWTEFTAPEYLAPEYREALARRWAEHFRWIESEFDDNHAEWAQIWPVTQHPHLAGHHGSRRMYRAFEPFMDHQLLAIAAQAPASSRIDGSLFRQMARPLLKPTRGIPHADGSIPYHGPWVNVPVKFAMRKIRRAQRNRRCEGAPPSGSWPSWPNLAGSQSMAEALARHETSIYRLATLFNASVSAPPEILGTKERFRLLQLAILREHLG